jgi:4-hydroxy-2-oxoglutarate aldolase
LYLCQDNETAMVRLHGIIPPLPTSFHDNEKLYPEKIRENIGALFRYDISGIVVMGSNGEFVMLSEGEKEKVYAAAREAVPAGKLLIAGTGAQSTLETIRLTKLAARQEADAALVLNPFYYKGMMTPEVLIRHYHDVAEASTIPIIIYNMPSYSGVDMTALTILKIASHPNIIGIKDSDGNIVKLGEVIRESREDFSVLAGSAEFLLPALVIGARGGIMALANLLPRKCIEIMKHFEEDRLDEARKIQQSIIPLNTAMAKKWGVPALKAAMDHLGMYGGPVRRPLMALEDRKREILVKMLDTYMELGL